MNLDLVECILLHVHCSGCLSNKITAEGTRSHQRFDFSVNLILTNQTRQVDPACKLKTKSSRLEEETEVKRLH